MNTWLQLVNELKRRSPDELLTVTERTTYDSIWGLLQFPQWINLYGGYGTGKTFLAWALARAGGMTYVPLYTKLDSIMVEQNALLVDNAPHDEFGSRQILARCELLGANTVILITRMPITMPMRRLELLPPSPADIEIMIRSLSRMGYLCDQSLFSAPPNFWDILRACV